MSEENTISNWSFRINDQILGSNHYINPALINEQETPFPLLLAVELIPAYHQVQEFLASLYNCTSANSTQQAQEIMLQLDELFGNLHAQCSKWPASREQLEQWVTLRRELLATTNAVHSLQQQIQISKQLIIACKPEFKELMQADLIAHVKQCMQDLLIEEQKLKQWRKKFGAQEEQMASVALLLDLYDLFQQQVQHHKKSKF